MSRRASNLTLAALEGDLLQIESVWLVAMPRAAKAGSPGQTQVSVPLHRAAHLAKCFFRQKAVRSEDGCLNQGVA